MKKVAFNLVVAFSGCANLTNTIVPENVTIGEEAFGGCEKLNK